MNKSAILGLGVSLIFSITICHIPGVIFAQTLPAVDNSSKMTSDIGKSVVSVNASVTVQVSNQTLKIREGMLRSSVVSLINSGSNVFKTSDSDQSIIKSKIVNEINNATQSVQGIEATNAIIGVEISKALKSVVSTTGKLNQAAIVTIETLSTCKPLTVKSISCENTITISD